eukprot:GDKI01039575.1.p2 GENE.GDKI01039575.1~~GDKI01039575.1.p2  ORF type:complete len:103 (+),score=36.36 GDKI01039575.1:70-378(+)
MCVRAARRAEQTHERQTHMKNWLTDRKTCVESEMTDTQTAHKRLCKQALIRTHGNTRTHPHVCVCVMYSTPVIMYRGAHSNINTHTHTLYIGGLLPTIQIKK